MVQGELLCFCFSHSFVGGLGCRMFAVRRVSAVTVRAARVAPSVRPSVQCLGSLRFRGDAFDERRSALESRYFDKEGALGV